MIIPYGKIKIKSYLTPEELVSHLHMVISDGEKHNYLPRGVIKTHGLEELFVTMMVIFVFLGYRWFSLPHFLYLACFP